MKDNNKPFYLMLIGIGIIIINNVNGHYNPPSSINWTPVVIPFIVIIVNRTLYKLNFIQTIIYNYSLIAFNDYLIRAYAGGNTDIEGNMWIAFYGMIGFIISTIAMLVFAGINTQEGKLPKKKIFLNFISIPISSLCVGLVYEILYKY